MFTANWLKSSQVYEPDENVWLAHFLMRPSKRVFAIVKKYNGMEDVPNKNLHKKSLE